VNLDNSTEGATVRDAVKLLPLGQALLPQSEPLAPSWPTVAALQLGLPTLIQGALQDTRAAGADAAVRAICDMLQLLTPGCGLIAPGLESHEASYGRNGLAYAVYAAPDKYNGATAAVSLVQFPPVSRRDAHAVSLIGTVTGSIHGPYLSNWPDVPPVSSWGLELRELSAVDQGLPTGRSGSYDNRVHLIVPDDKIAIHDSGYKAFLAADSYAHSHEVSFKYERNPLTRIWFLAVIMLKSTQTRECVSNNN
jgi:hypothetical protein